MSDSWMFFILLLWLFGISIWLRVQSTMTDRIERKLDILLRHAAIDTNAAIEDEVKRLIVEDKKETAVAYYRELTGVEKKVAKQHVDDVELRLLQQKLQS